MDNVNTNQDWIIIMIRHIGVPCRQILLLEVKGTGLFMCFPTHCFFPAPATGVQQLDLHDIHLQLLFTTVLAADAWISLWDVIRPFTVFALRLECSSVQSLAIIGSGNVTESVGSDCSCDSDSTSDESAVSPLPLILYLGTFAGSWWKKETLFARLSALSDSVACQLDKLLWWFLILESLKALDLWIQTMELCKTKGHRHSLERPPWNSKSDLESLYQDNSSGVISVIYTRAWFLN